MPNLLFNLYREIPKFAPPKLRNVGYNCPNVPFWLKTIIFIVLKDWRLLKWRQG